MNLASAVKITIPEGTDEITIPAGTDEITIPEKTIKITIPERTVKITMPIVAKPTAQEESVVITIPEGASEGNCVKSGDCFNPQYVEVDEFETINWKNDDHVTHLLSTDITYDSKGHSSGETFGSAHNNQEGIIPPGGKFHIYADHTSNYIHYFCQIHPFMQGVIKVNSLDSNNLTFDANSVDVSRDKASFLSTVRVSDNQPPTIAIILGDMIFSERFAPTNTHDEFGFQIRFGKLLRELASSPDFGYLVIYDNNPIPLKQKRSPDEDDLEYGEESLFENTRLKMNNASAIDLINVFSMNPEDVLPVETTEHTVTIKIKPETNEIMYLIISRALIDAKTDDDNDKELTVFIDGKEQKFEEEAYDFAHILKVEVSSQNREITIEGNTKMVDDSGNRIYQFLKDSYPPPEVNIIAYPVTPYRIDVITGNDYSDKHMLEVESKDDPSTPTKATEFYGDVANVDVLPEHKYQIRVSTISPSGVLGAPKTFDIKTPKDTTFEDITKILYWLSPAIIGAPIFVFILLRRKKQRLVIRDLKDEYDTV